MALFCGICKPWKLQCRICSGQKNMKLHCNQYAATFWCFLATFGVFLTVQPAPEGAISDDDDDGDNLESS